MQAAVKAGKARFALKGYQRIQKCNLKEAMWSYLADLVKQAAVVSVEWWDKLKPLKINTKVNKKPQYLKPIPELIDKFGVPFPTAQQAADGWVKSFAAIEGGEVTTASQIADIVLREAATHLASHYIGPVTDLIFRRQAKEALRKTKSGSAPGPDGITVGFL